MPKHLETAFQQFHFAWKLYSYAMDGGIEMEKLDVPLTFTDENNQSIFVLQDKIFQTQDDLILACENNLVIAFGAAVIALNRCREESGLRLPDPIVSDVDQFIALIYQIRNAFAHDIAEPRWNLTNPRYARRYEFGGIQVDLSSVGVKQFEYSDIGGVEVLDRIKDFGLCTLWP